MRIPAVISSLLSRDRASGQALRFVVVGVSNTVVTLGVFALLARVFYVPDIPANALAYILGIVNSFIWNKYWTFGASKSGRGWREFSFFFLVNLPPLVVNVVVFSALNLGFRSGSFLVREGETFVAALVAVAWNFLGSRYLAFRHTALKRPLKNDASLPERDGYARETDAGSANSSAICATEDTVSRRPVCSGGRGVVLQRPVKKDHASETGAAEDAVEESQMDNEEHA